MGTNPGRWQCCSFLNDSTCCKLATAAAAAASRQRTAAGHVAATGQCCSRLLQKQAVDCCRSRQQTAAAAGFRPRPKAGMNQTIGNAGASSTTGYAANLQPRRWPAAAGQAAQPSGMPVQATGLQRGSSLHEPAYCVKQLKDKKVSLGTRFEYPKLATAAVVQLIYHHYEQSYLQY